jgi:hypothetical protein
MPDPRLFIGIFPAGIVYADRTTEKQGDYKRLAFLDYATLTRFLEDDCPPDLRSRIIADAATLQLRRGRSFTIASSGQTVRLRSALPDAIQC